jgi:hypothetical protein
MQAAYGGMKTRMQRLQSSSGAENQNLVLLMGNSIALTCWQPQQDGTFHVVQKYFGWRNGHFQIVAQHKAQTQKV